MLGALRRVSLAQLAATAEEAFSGFRALVYEVLSDMHDNSEARSAPLADRAYSGKFLVRVPPETHRALVLHAAEEGVSGPVEAHAGRTCSSGGRC